MNHSKTSIFDWPLARTPRLVVTDVDAFLAEPGATEAMRQTLAQAAGVSVLAVVPFVAWFDVFLHERTFRHFNSVGFRRRVGIVNRWTLSLSLSFFGLKKGGKNAQLSEETPTSSRSASPRAAAMVRSPRSTTPRGHDACRVQYARTTWWSSRPLWGWRLWAGGMGQCGSPGEAFLYCFF